MNSQISERLQSQNYIRSHICTDWFRTVGPQLWRELYPQFSNRQLKCLIMPVWHCCFVLFVFVVVFRLGLGFCFCLSLILFIHFFFVVLSWVQRFVHCPRVSQRVTAVGARTNRSLRWPNRRNMDVGNIRAPMSGRPFMDIQGVKKVPGRPAVSRRTRFHADFTFSYHQGEPYQTNYHKKIPVEIMTK
jgi:hypothetical protein